MFYSDLVLLLFLLCRSWRYLLTTRFPSRCWSCQPQCAAWTWAPPARNWLWWTSTTLCWSTTSTAKNCFFRSADRALHVWPRSLTGQKSHSSKKFETTLKHSPCALLYDKYRLLSLPCRSLMLTVWLGTPSVKTCCASLAVGTLISRPAISQFTSRRCRVLWLATMARRSSASMSIPCQRWRYLRCVVCCQPVLVWGQWPWYLWS